MDVRKPGANPNSGNSPNGGMPPQGGGANPKLNIDPNDLLDVTCNECGNNTFAKIHFIKKVSKVVSPNGEEGLVPVPSFECAECGYVNEQFKDFEKE